MLGRIIMAGKRKVTAKQLAALEPTKWKKGQSGNPAGRPKGITLSEAYRNLLASPFPSDAEAELAKMIKRGASIADVLAFMMVKHIVRGNVSAAVEIRRATEGDNVQINTEWRVAAMESGINPEEIINILANGIRERI